MYKRIILLLIYCWVYSYGFTQSVEKIHLHLDKDIYLPGETIWFKAYLLYNNQPSFLSTNFYVAIYDDDGKLMLQKQYPVFDGSCYGDIILPDSLSTSSIRIRAVTKGVFLSDSAGFYERMVRIFQQGRTATEVILPNQNVSIQFFPEGGNAVAGFQNSIAVKALKNKNMPVAVSGKIIETVTANFIDSFFTDTNGLGKILITPEEGKSYTAIWKANNNVEQTNIVVNNATNGVLFHSEIVKNLLYCNILKNVNNVRFNTLKISAIWGNSEVLNISANMQNKTQWISKIPLDSLPDGIICLRLLDADSNILQQRIILNDDASNKNKITVDILEKSLQPKGKNRLLLNIPDSMQYNLSVSVTDISFYDTNNHTSIKQNLWLSGDIFTDRAKIQKTLQNGAQDNLDLLLMSARANTINSETALVNNPLDNYLSIQANYRDKNYAMPSGNKLSLIIKDTLQGKQFLKLEPSNQNDFVKEGLIFFDSTEVNFQLDKDKEQTKFLTINTREIYTAAPFISRMEYFSVDSILRSSNSNSENAIIDFAINKPKKFNEKQTMKEVIVKSKYNNPEIKRIQQLENKYTSGMFSGLARGYQLNVIDDKNAWAQSDVLNYIVYRVPGLGVFTIYGERFIGDPRSKGKILTFLNETELPDQIGLQSISMTQVAYIKYIPGIVLGSSFTTTGGVLYIYTKKGDEMDVENNSVMPKVKLKGYDIAQDFASPDYNDKKNLLNTDMRTTLYWNPYIVTDGVNNKIEIKFNNNDISKKLLLTIEGFSEEGKLVHIEKVIEDK